MRSPKKNMFGFLIGIYFIIFIRNILKGLDVLVIKENRFN